MMIILLFVLGFFAGIIINLYIFKIRKKISYRDLFKSRKISRKIFSKYFMIEIVTAVIYSLLYLASSPRNFHDWVILGAESVLMAFLIFIFIYDYKYYLIPNKIIYPAILIALCFSFLNIYNSWQSSFVGAAVSSAFFLFFVLISKEKWMGWGDVKLSFFIGVILGWPYIILGLLMSFIIGGVISLIQVIFKIKRLGSKMPMGTFLALGTMIVFLWGNYILDNYFNILNL